MNLTLRPFRFSATALLAAGLALSAVSLHAQADIPLDGPGLLPLPSPNVTPIAGWVAQNRSLVWDADDSAYYLDYTGAWAGASPFAANYVSPAGSGASYSISIVSGSAMNFGGSSSLYPMNGASFRLDVADYSGPASSTIIFQAVLGYSSSDPVWGLNDQISVTTPSLTIGGQTFVLDADFYTSERGFGDLSNTESRYFGHYGSLALVTMVWDLDALGYTGSIEDFSINWNQGAHSVIYDAQLSVAPIPEPSTWALIGVAGIAGLILKRKRSAQA